MWLEWYLMLLLVLFAAAAPPQFLPSDDYESNYDDVESEDGKIIT